MRRQDRIEARRGRGPATALELAQRPGEIREAAANSRASSGRLRSKLFGVSPAKVQRVLAT
jgi:hypothetical protein